MSQLDDMRQRYLASHHLDVALVSVAIDECEITLHYHLLTQSLWRVKTCPTGVGASIISADFGICDIGSKQTIYGLLPSAVKSVRASLAIDNTPLTTHLGQGVYVVIAPMRQPIKLAFVDDAGQNILELLTPTPPSPSRSLLDQIRLWAYDNGLLRAPKHVHTYGPGVKHPSQK